MFQDELDAGETSRAGKLRGLVRSLADKLAPTTGDVARDDERVDSVRCGGTPCKDITGRRQVTVAGTLRSVTLCPQMKTPSLHAELSDGSGSITVVWLGRRDIVGIVAGARLKVWGLAARHDGRLVMYNPRYELLSPAKVGTSA